MRIDDAVSALHERAGDQFKPPAYYTNPNFREAVAAVLDTVRNRSGALLLTGEPGTGKTLLVRHAINELRGEVQLVTLFAPRLSFAEIMELAASVLHVDDADGDAEPATASPAERLNRYLDREFEAGRPVVIFIDDAHAVPESTLIELFGFIRPDAQGRCRLQAILSGLPRLEVLTQRQALKGLVGEGFRAVRLLPMSEREAAEFASLLFAGTDGTLDPRVAPDAIERIAERSGGIRRLVCTLVDAARMAAELEEAGTVTGATVDEAVAFLSPAWAWEEKAQEVGARQADAQANSPEVQAPASPELHSGNDAVESLADRNPDSFEPLPLRAFEQIATLTPTVTNDQAATPTAPIAPASEAAESRSDHHVEVPRMRDNVLTSLTGRDSPAFRTDHLNKVLKNLQHGSPDVEAAALISEDGLMIASALPQELDDTRVAGMSATLLSLGTRAAHELGRGDVQEVVVRGVQGYTVMVDAGRGVLLLVVANENAKLGLIFFDMREAIQALRSIL